MSTTIVLSQPIASLVAEVYKTSGFSIKFQNLYTLYLPEGQSVPTTTWISMILGVWEDFAQAKLDITPDELVEQMETWAMDNVGHEHAAGLMQHADAFREELIFSDCLSESIEFSIQYQDEIFGSSYGNSEDPFGYSVCFAPGTEPAMRKHICFSM